ncbi:hypothetical protein ASA1KI_07970 [Opitutales bacterium ASA1]|nr:hypothetical protein ASA1KI_07970 [Opitutales bacterium ASA1]
MATAAEVDGMARDGEDMRMYLFCGYEGESDEDKAPADGHRGVSAREGRRCECAV